MVAPTLKMGYGNWVDGDKFWGRSNDLALFSQRVDEGAHQLLTAQRRMGKTSLMRETARRHADQYTCTFVDLQKAATPADMIVELSMAVKEHGGLFRRVAQVFPRAVEKFRDNVDSVNAGDLRISFRDSVAGNWPLKGDQLMDVLAKSPRPVLLLIDEIPILVNRILKGPDFKITAERREEADRLLTWLRDNSLKHQGAIRMVLSGSIGLEPVLKQGGLSASLNNFVPFELRPWDHETAVGCLRALATTYAIEFDAGIPERMIEYLGCCIPHHVQMFFRHVHDHCTRADDRRVTATAIDEIYAAEMLNIRGHVELTHYEERLRLVLEEELRTLAHEFLSEAAVSGRLSAESMTAHCRHASVAVPAAREVLDLLEHDGYLEREDDGYRFASKLLRDWWRSRHGFGFVPVLERPAGHP